MGLCGGGGDNKVEETPEQQELAKIAVEQHQRHEELFKPVEDEFIAQAQSIDAGDADSVASAATAGVAGDVEATQGARRAQDIGAGATPGSGRFNESAGEVQRAGATATGTTEAAARQGTTEQGVALKEAAIGIGLGQEGEALDTMSDVARKAHLDAVDRARDRATDAAMRESAVGQIAGFGARQYMRGGDGPGTSGSPGVGASTPRRPAYNANVGVGGNTPRNF